MLYGYYLRAQRTLFRPLRVGERTTGSHIVLFRLHRRTVTITEAGTSPLQLPSVFHTCTNTAMPLLPYSVHNTLAVSAHARLGGRQMASHIRGGDRRAARSAGKQGFGAEQALPVGFAGKMGLLVEDVHGL